LSREQGYNELDFNLSYVVGKPGFDQNVTKYNR
jgi:hypothetical protein